MKALTLFCVLLLSASFATANEGFCRAPVLKQAREQLKKTASIEKIEVVSVNMGENHSTFVLKAFSKTSSGRQTELFDAQVDSDCKILQLEAQPDSQRSE